MRRALSAVAALAPWAAPAAGQAPDSFAQAKRLLAGVHQDIGHMRTLYCGCPYTRRGRSGGDIDRAACGLEARRNDKRSDRVEWEHVAPVSRFGRGRSCWTAGHALCVKKNGKPFKGRRCCLMRGVDDAFRAAHNDPHNLFPAGGETTATARPIPSRPSRASREATGPAISR